VHVGLLELFLIITQQVIKNFSLEERNLQGEIFHLNNIGIFNNNGKVKRDLTTRLNTFWISSTNKSKTLRHYADLSILNSKGFEITRNRFLQGNPRSYYNYIIYLGSPILKD